MDLREVRTNDPTYTKIYDILRKTPNISGDSESYCHTSNDIAEIQSCMYQAIQSNMVGNQIPYQTLSQVRSDAVSGYKKLAGDGFFNPASGIGVHGADPQLLTNATIPVVFGPMETCTIYTNGGLPALIIDKKTRGMIAQGITFRSHDPEFWTEEKIEQLEEAAEVTGLNEQLTASMRDALVQGGSVLYPIFTDDNKKRFDFSLEGLHLEKNCIHRWLSIDRWNVVYVPSYIVTAEDYLRPKHIYIPLGGYSVHTTRMAIVKPKPLPYWSVMFNLGWGPSDYSGYMRALLAYEIFHMSANIIAQQMSLLLYQLPLDSMQATLGPAAIKELMAVNQQKLQEWSILKPQAVNMVGEVAVVERTFAGFDNFFSCIKSNLSAQCGLAEPSMFHTPNKGFQDNTKESSLKQSETMQLLASNLIYQYTKPVTSALLAHVFGSESEEFKKRHTLFLSFDKPVPSTELDMAEIAARFAASVASLAQANVPADKALLITKQFFKGIKIDEETLKEVKKNAEEMMKIEKDAAKMKKQQGLASPGRAGNAGKATRPGPSGAKK